MAPSPLSSTANPRVRALRALWEAEGRRTQAAFLIEGPKLLSEALAAGLRPTEALVSPRLAHHPLAAHLRAALARAGTPVQEAEDRVLDAVSDAASHQGVVARAALVGHPRALAPSPDEDPLVVVSCGVQDPGNQGALVRLAEAFGAAALLAAGGADPWSPRAVRAAAGSLFRIPVARHDDPLDLLRGLRVRGYRLAAAVPRGGQPPAAASGITGVALVLGGEGRGLAEPLEPLCDLRLTVPLAHPVESLNVATAAAVLLYALSAPERESRGSSRR